MQRAATYFAKGCNYCALLPSPRRAVALVARVHRTHGRPATRVGRGRRRWLPASRPSPSRHGGFGRDPRRRRVYYYYYLHSASPAKAHLQAAPALNSPSRSSSRGDISDIYVVGVSGFWPQHGTGRVRPAARPWLHVSAPARRRWTPRHRPRHRDREATSSRPSTGLLGSGAAGHARRIAGAVKEAGLQ